MSHHFIAYVNSKLRSSGSSSDFTYTIDLPKNTGYDSYDSICMLQASIPKSYYLINTGRNMFTLVEGISQATVVIPRGNYTRRSFAIVLGTQLNLASPNGLNYTISVPNVTNGPETGKYLITITNNVTDIPVSLVFGSNSSPAAQMGFPPESTNDFTNDTLESAYVCQLQISQSVFILCDNVINGHTHILQEIFTASPDFSNISFNVGLSGGLEANGKRLKSALTNSWHFKIMTPDYELIDLEGLDVVFSLVLWKSISQKIESEPVAEATSEQ